MSTRTDGAEMPRKQFINPPPREVPEGAPRSEATAEFGRRLQRMMVDKGWNQSELARQASRFMPKGKHFRRDNVSLYVRGLQVPGPVRLSALCKALGTTPQELVPSGAFSSVDETAPPLSIKALTNGQAWLQINQAVSMDVAMRVVAILEQARTEKR